MSKNRITEIDVDINNMSVTEKLEEGKIVLLVLDGTKGKAKKCEVVDHGETTLETQAGKLKRITFTESDLW